MHVGTRRGQSLISSSFVWAKTRKAWVTVVGGLVLVVVVLALLPSDVPSSPSKPGRKLSFLSGGSLWPSLINSEGAQTMAGARGAQALGQVQTHSTSQGSKATPEEVERLLSRVERDLEPWKESGITLEMVERSYCTEEIIESMRFQIINGTVFLVGLTGNYQTRAQAYQVQLAELSRHYKLPDVDFVLSTGDKCKPGEAPHRSHDGNLERCPRVAPLLANDRLDWEPQCVPVPDFAFGGWPEASLPPWPLAKGLIAGAADRLSWEQRQDKIFWKGGATNNERTVLAESGVVQDSGLADIHLIDWSVSREDFAKNFVSLSDHCNFKYLLHVGGVSYSSRLKYLMLCNSTVVFPNMQHKEFWYHMLEDQKNIVLTEENNWGNNGEPLLRAVRDLAANQTKAQQIAAAGRHLGAEILHPDNVRRYWLEVLMQYNALQRFKVVQHADAIPLDVALLRPERIIPISERTCKVC